jgi:hypothetical protein
MSLSLYDIDAVFSIKMVCNGHVLTEVRPGWRVLQHFSDGKRETFLLTYLLFFGLTYKMYFASIMFPHESIFLSLSIVSERRHVASL